MSVSWTRRMEQHVPQGLTPGPILSIIFISDLGNGCKSGEDTKLGGMVDTPEGRAAIQRVLNWLETQADSKLLKFNNGNCQVLHLRGITPYISTHWRKTLESSVFWQTWGFWWTISWPWASNCVLDIRHSPGQLTLADPALSGEIGPYDVQRCLPTSFILFDSTCLPSLYNFRLQLLAIVRDGTPCWIDV